jgi:uncharacterized protein
MKKNREKKNKRTATRMCIACRKRSPKRELARFVLDENGVPVLDESGSIPGRGASVCADRECLENAIERGAFNRAWDVSIPREVWDNVRKDFEAFLSKRKFRAGAQKVVHRISKEEAENVLDKKVTRS